MYILVAFARSGLGHLILQSRVNKNKLKKKIKIMLLDSFQWDLVCEKKELPEISQTLMMLGQGFGAFIFTSLSDRFGRKRIHIACHTVLFAIAMATAFVPNFTSFAIMRMLTGAFQQVICL